jgi:hypothetical protein
LQKLEDENRRPEKLPAEAVPDMLSWSRSRASAIMDDFTPEARDRRRHRDRRPPIAVMVAPGPRWVAGDR